jgi:serine/threonine-protein kinase
VDRLKPDEVLRDRYRVVRLIGRGGMGEVYEAVDLEKGCRVAIKTVLAKLRGSVKVVARFRREIELSQRISHPNVLHIYDVFELPPRPDDPEGSQATSPCMVMEYLEGETLADRLGDGGTVPPEEARGLVIQMAHALAAAHRADVVHRDLKPDNIFLVPRQGGATRVVLTDFGVARPNNSPEQEDSFTATDVIVGTPTYMAPEQLELEEALPASDIYTLGLVIYQMLTGKFPFEGDTAIQVVFMRVQEDPIPPRRFMPELDDVWDHLILRCLERDPKERLRDAAEIVTILEGGKGDLPRDRKKWPPSSWWPF